MENIGLIFNLLLIVVVSFIYGYLKGRNSKIKEGTPSASHNKQRFQFQGWIKLLLFCAGLFSSSFIYEIITSQWRWQNAFEHSFFLVVGALILAVCSKVSWN